MDSFEILERLRGKVLVRFPNWIGDAVMASPTLKILKSRLKDADLVIVAPKHVCELFKFHRPPVEVLPVPPVKNLKSFFKNVRILKKKKFEGAILFQNAFSAAFTTFLAGIPFRAGLDTDGRTFLLNVAVPFDKVRNIHQAEIFYFIAQFLTGCLHHDDELLPSLFVEESEVAVVKNKFSIDQPYLVVHPGAAYGTAKRWFPERFANVARMIQKEFNLLIVLAGSEQESALCSRIKGMLKDCRVINVSGKTSIREMLGLQAGSELVISNDSGPMHTSAAVGTKTVAIFGPTNPEKTGPKNRNCRIIYKKIDCAPCKLRHCPYGHRCMQEITEGDVFSVVSQMLSNTDTS